MKNPIEILHFDTAIVVVNKPSGFLSISDRYDPEAPVVLNFLEKDFGTLFVVHRIDKDTSGVLAYARDPETHRILNGQFSTHAVEKAYLALVRGEAEEDEWICDLPLLTDADRLHRTIIDARRGKEAVSHFAVLERFRDFTLVQVRPETGRTHQIRVHCAATGYPIVADPLYGDGKALFLSQLKRRWKGDAYEERPLMARTALHAEKIRFVHPVSKEDVEFAAPIPRDFNAALSQLRKI